MCIDPSSTMGLTFSKRSILTNSEDTMERMTMDGWCTLIQRVNDDCSALTQEVVGAGADYGQWGVPTQVKQAAG